jgi:DNA-binding phage protein
MPSYGAAFDKYLAKRKRDPAFAKEYAESRAEIDAIDRLVHSLDEVRETKGVSKAALARAIGARPEMVRRLMTADGQNPTLRTVVKLASELGCHLELVPDRSGKPTRSRRVERRAG